MVLMVKSGVRGSVTQSVTRHLKANNNYLSDYDETKPPSFLAYFDANTLYG